MFKVTRFLLILSVVYLVAAQRRHKVKDHDSHERSSEEKVHGRHRGQVAHGRPFDYDDGDNSFEAEKRPFRGGGGPNNMSGERPGKRKAKGHKQRLCEQKYAEYIERIFPNDNDTKADANESEFDGRELPEPGEYPHMTALGFESADNAVDYKCGGSLISENFIITAAHCTSLAGETPKTVRIGDLNLVVDEQYLEPQIRGIQQIFNHPQYQANSYYNDIALLQLNDSIHFTVFVRPIRLWVLAHMPFTTAYAMGYGATSFGRARTNRLTDFNMTIVSNEDCNRELPSMPENALGIAESQICARDFQKNRDTCQGDSGGPLQLNIRGRRKRDHTHYHLIGITSFGFFCRSSYPGVYTRVYTFLDWIESVVWSV